MSIFVDEWGLNFVGECFRRFQGEGIFFYIFAAALVYLLLREKSEWKKSFFSYIVVLFVTIFNPLLITPFIDKLGLEDEYYRLVWLLPITIFIAWFAVAASEKCKKRWLRFLCYGFFFLLIAFPGKSILASNWGLAENLYKVPDELIEICNVIHQDSTDTDESPKAAMDFDLIVLMGQYDPSIELTLAYSDVSFLASQVDNENFAEQYPPGMQSQMHIYRVLREGQMIDGMEFAGALAWTDTDYVVVRRDFPLMDYLMTQRCEKMYETETYCILKYVEE